MDVDEQNFTTKCKKCLLELDKPGAILLSPPDKGEQVQKIHLCSVCYEVVVEGLRPILLMDPCEVDQCQRRAMPGRKICENHAFPAARPKHTTGRRAAIAATKRKMAEAQVSDESAEEE